MNEQNSPEYPREVIVAQMQREYKRGLVADNTLGLHGTSLEALQYLVANGVLPGETSSGLLAHDLGDIFYWSIGEEGLSENLLAAARGSARENAQSHFVASELGLDLSNTQDKAMVKLIRGIYLDQYEASIRREHRQLPPERLENYLDYIKQQHIRHYGRLFARHGWTESQISRLLEAAEEQNGLILGIDIRAGTDYSISDLARTRRRSLRFSDRYVPLDVGEMRIVTNGEGLPFSYIRGILPLGRREQAGLRSLKG